MSEIWLGWLKRESGAQGYACMGDKGRAYGAYQFDYRYALVPFLKYLVNRNEKKYAEFKPFTKYGAGNTTLVSNATLKNLFVKFAKDADFCKAQDEYAKSQYYDAAASYLKKKHGIDAEKHSAVFRGSLFSMSIRSGQQNGANRMNQKGTEEQILRKAYGTYGTEDANRWTEKGQLGDALKALKEEQESMANVSASAVMKTALKYIGVTEYPANSNNVIFNTDYYGKPVSGADYPWCCAFVWDIFRIAGASKLFYGGKKTAYCPTYEQWALGKGLNVDKNKGKYGDVATMDFGKGRASHIGFILKKNADGTYQTIEGNTSLSSQDNGGAVMERTRTQASIRYIFRPQYGEEKETGNAVIKAGQQHSINFTGHKIDVDGFRGAETRKQAVRVLQTGLNLDYQAQLDVDGICGAKTKSALVGHYVKRGEKQYMVTVAEILLMLLGRNPNGVECPGEFGSGLQAAAGTNKITADMFLSYLN